MAAGARWQPARWIAAVVKRSAFGAFSASGASRGHIERKVRVMEGDRDAFALAQPPGDPGHLRMVPLPFRVRAQLSFKISGIEPGQSGSARPVALPLEAVTGDARIGSARAGPAQRHQLASRGKSIERSSIRSCAASQRRGRQAKGQRASQHFNRSTSRPNRGFRLALLSLTIVSCKPPPDDRQAMPGADAQAGLQVIERVGCGSCHVIPGVDWPKGTVGPALGGLANRALIAGKLPNRPDLLAAYIQNAPALVPGSGMPAMPVSADEARDVAAYLYEKGQR
ncbi:hypothetical protein [Altererythrobacter sp. TH136]|uniref:c-type cytochrome n=1 Tax=Altererythrobacter sp. TH136 TaxID=2067415 RepID=UPI001FEFB0A4|nr:hypothetical protein [Altererythrobacter sp. TH136]